MDVALVIGGEEVYERAGRPERNHHADHTPEHADDDALGKELARETPTACTERAAESKLSLPRNAAREQKPAEVRARYRHEHDGYRREERAESRVIALL